MFDHQRIRLKRPARAGDADQRLDFDPYRTSLSEPIPPHVKKLFVRLALIFGIAVGITLLFATALEWLFR